MPRRVADLFCATSLCLCVAVAALWASSHGQRGAVYTGRGGFAGALAWAPGELSLWFGRVDPRVRLNPAHFQPAASDPPSALAWFDRDKAAGAATRGRLGAARCSNFPSVIPRRVVRGPVSALVAPFWLLVAATAAAPLARAVGTLRRRSLVRRRKRLGHCVRCGYDLRATAAVCPECGAGPAGERPKTRPTVRRAIPLVAACTALGCALVLCRPRTVPWPAQPAPWGSEGPNRWLRRATVHARGIDRWNDRVDACCTVLRGYLMTRDAEGAADLLRSAEADARAEGDRRFVSYRADLARACAFLGDEQNFWRNALPAERRVEDEKLYLGINPLWTAYAWRGDFEAVGSLAAALPDPRERIYDLYRVSIDPAAPDAGKVARGVIPLLRVAADTAAYWGEQSDALFRVAQLQIRLGDLAAADATVHSIPGDGYRANALEELAAAYALAGNNTASAAALHEASAVRPRPSTHPTMVANDRIQDVRDALDHRDSAAAARALVAADEAVSANPDARLRENEWCSLAMTLADAGDLDGCRRILARVGTLPLAADDDRPHPAPSSPAAGSIGSLAVAVAGAGDLPWAIRLMDLMQEPHRALTYSSIVWSLAHAGDLEAAKQFAREKLRPTDRASAARTIAYHHVKHRGTAGLLEWAESLPTAEERANALIGAAEAVAGQHFSEPFP